MNNKRKTGKNQVVWPAVLLAGLMLFSGCSQQGGQEQLEQPESSIQETGGNVESSSRKEGAEAEKEVEQKRIETAPGQDTIIRTPAPVLSSTHWQDNRYAEDGTLLAEGSFQALEVSPEGYEAVAESIKEWFVGEEEEFLQSMNAQEELALEAYENLPSFFTYYTHREYSSTRADNSVISIARLYDGYYGGAHGIYGTTGTTFDAGTGEKLSFWDLTDNQEEFAGKTLDYCLKLVEEKYEKMLFADYEATIRAGWKEEPNWYLDGAGITIIFNPYEIGPYAMGEGKITLPYSEFSELLLPEYQWENQAGVAVLSEGVEAEVSLGQAAGQRESIQLFARPIDEENYGLRTYALELGEKTEMVAEMDRLVSAYLLQREDGRSFLLFYGDMASEDYVTYLYELTDGMIRKTDGGEIGAFIQEGSVTTQGLTLGIRVDALGTHTAYGDYRLTKEGNLEMEGEWYSIPESPLLTTVRELPVMVDGKEGVLPAGSRIQLTGTDGKGVLLYQKINSTEMGQIHFTRGENGESVYIDGIEEEAYFENLLYVG